MSSTQNQTRVVAIHDRAMSVAREYRSCEVELIESLQEVDRYKVYLHHRCNSLFKYVTELLGLSEEVAYIFIGVARKAMEVPALKSEISEGRITVTKARRLASVIDSSNQKHWLDLARNSSKQKLEKEIALAKPEEAVRDQLQFKTEPVERVSLKRDIARVQLQVGVSEDLMVQIRHAQDLISQKKGKSVGLEEVLYVLVGSYIKREDPVEKAKRSKIKGENKSQVSEEHATQPLRKLCPGTVVEMPASKDEAPARSFKSPANFRIPFTAKQKHEVFLKYRGRCSFEMGGKQCGQRRFLQIHHKIPVSLGGTKDPNNLVLLCSGHHRALHLNEYEPH